MKVFKDIVARRRPLSQDGADAEAVPVARPIAASIPEPMAPVDDEAPQDYQGPDPDLERARLARDAVPQKEVEKAPQFPKWERANTRLVTPEEAAGAPAPTVPEPPARKKIWDLEPADEEDMDVAVPEDVPAAPAEPPARPAMAAPPVATPAAPGRPGARVKTRLLGFHSDELQQRDVFAEKATPASATPPRFPIGWVVVMEGPGRGASFTLTGGLSTIGRGEDQTVALAFGDSSISRDNHASIAFDEEENRAYIGHGGKSNIVRLNGKPLLSTEVLTHGDEMRIGKTTLKFVGFCGPDFSWTGAGKEGEQADG